MTEMTVRLACLIVLLSGIALTAAAGPVAVVLPLGNAAGTPEASSEVEALVVEQLTRQGWTVAPAEETERALEELRLRYLDSLTRETLQVLCERFDASVVVTGSILAHRENGNRVVAVGARMIARDGATLWADLRSRSSAEAESAFGLGRNTTSQQLLRDCVERLMRGAPPPSSADRPTTRRLRLADEAAMFTSNPQTYRSSSHPKGTSLRVCVLPFVSKFPEAGRVMLEILNARLEATGEFEVVEPAEFREGMRRAGLRSVSTMTSSELARLGAEIGTPLFLRGNVHAWREGTGGRSEVQLDMTLVDVSAGTILWAVTHQRRGSDYAGILGRGTVENVVALADLVVSETLESQHRARPRGGHRRPLPGVARER